MSVTKTKVLLILALILILLNSVNIVVLSRAPEKPTGGAVGTVKVFIYPSDPEASNQTTINTINNIATINSTDEDVKAYFEIETGTDVSNETLYAYSYDRNIEPVSISNKSFLRTYLVDGSSNLSSSLSQLTVKFYYEDSWVSSRNLVESTLRLYQWDGSAWQGLSSLNTSANYVEGTTDSFGTFGVFGTEVAEEVSLAAPGGGGAGAKEEVGAIETILTAPPIIEKAQKVISAPIKKAIQYLAPVTRQYWPILLVATLLIIGIGYWVGKRRNS